MYNVYMSISQKKNIVVNEKHRWSNFNGVEYIVQTKIPPAMLQYIIVMMSIISVR
jgi:hypothetical protein